MTETKTVGLGHDEVQIGDFVQPNGLSWGDHFYEVASREPDGSIKIYIQGKDLWFAAYEKKHYPYWTKRVDGYVYVPTNEGDKEGDI